MALLDQDSLDCIKDAYKFVLENDYSSEFLDAIEFMKVLEITNLTDKLYQHFH